MLRLTKNTDYALMAINFMAGQEDAFVANTKTIAEMYHIPLELLAKILQRLAKSGIILSKSGPKGGYVLVKDAAQITIGEVIQAIEGPIRIVRCEDEDCSQMERCTVRGPLIRIERKIVSFLESITVEQMYEQLDEEENLVKLIQV
jgi:Rrf2 family protein